MSGRSAGRWFPYGPASRAVLIGTSRFTSPGLEDLPSVANSLWGMRDALTHPAHGLLAPEHCRVLADPADAAAIGEALNRAEEEARELLLVYYAGHGVLDEDGRLHLGLVPTDRSHVRFSGVPIDVVKRHLEGSAARARVLILDCCFSGRAISVMSDPVSLALGQLDLSGTYILTAAPKNAPALAPPGERYTAFTGALLGALGAPMPLTLDEIHAYADGVLSGRPTPMPRPQRLASGATGSLVLMRGPADTAGAAGAPGARGAARAVPPGPVPPPGAVPPYGAAPPYGAVPPYGPVPPGPAPRRPRRRGGPLLVAAAAAGGALAVVLVTSLVNGLAGADTGTTAGATGGNRTTQGTTGGGTFAPPPATGRTGTPPQGNTRPTPAADTATVVYRDRKLVWRAAACLGSALQELDLDKPATGPVSFTTLDTDLLYVGCLPGSQPMIQTNDLTNQVRVGAADAGTNTAAACRAAAQGATLGPRTSASKITAGTVWCVVTGQNQVAKVVFTKVDPADASSGAGRANPTFELSATLWNDAS
ncbi:hypothetical protein ADL22_02195 [Streptomyces sp. NRRL F-4489]|uniref:caspase family protein n=1 Tax=Streptomyces sp. NRRL F-4489 TaxID=1609095 RepID=UPI000747B76B|nr:caspase family protein [Streptomyces sp. NRRL F-4489]KUL54909.1 hypothetical protein ADL22_02195 [Streptomyces sp. NRRL F-4489]